MYVPQVVVDEMGYLKKFSKYKWVYEKLLDAIENKVFTVITTSNYSSVSTSIPNIDEISSSSSSMILLLFCFDFSRRDSDF